MRYQSIIGNCDKTTVSQLVGRCPATLTVFRNYLPTINEDSDRTIKNVAEACSAEPQYLCRDLFDVYMDHNPLEDLDAEHLAQLPRLHRLARKIEAIHRENPDVPKGITLAVKELEHSLTDHRHRENVFVLNHIKHDQPPRPETPIAQMNEEHSIIKQQLGKLRLLTRNYQAPDSACRSWRRLYQELKNLDFGLSEQIYLERDILFPRFQF
jgi:regulator of cell morphogenesis and NO signaling